MRRLLLFISFPLQAALLPVSPYLDASFEGIYRVRFHCQPGEVSLGCLSLQTRPIHLGIVNSRANSQVHVRFSHVDKEYGILYSNGIKWKHTFENILELQGTTLFLEIDPAKKTIQGWLRDPHFEKDLRISGIQLTSPLPLYADKSIASSEPPLTIANIVGRYRGKFGKYSGELVIKANPESGQPFLASFLYDIGQRLDFHITEFFPEQKVIHLMILGMTSGMPMKWTLSVRDVEGRTHLTGMNIYSHAGNTNSDPVTFIRGSRD